MAELCAIQTDLAMCSERLLTPEEIDDLPDLDYLVQGVLPEKSVCVLYGEPGSGKTIIALSLALTCTTGKPWIGREARCARILYVAAEGVLGMKYRLRAYRHQNEIAPGAVRFYTSLQITDPAAVRLLLSDLKAAEFEPDLIILDTLARVSVGKDENSAKDMGEIVAEIEALRRKHNAAVLVIHHTRKDGDSERGSSALRGAADVMIECKKSGDFENLVVLKCSKMKDDEPFPDLEIGLEKIDLGTLVAGAPPPLLDGTFKRRPSSAQDQHCERISQILTDKFSQSGASHGEIKRAYCEETKMSESAFNRAWRVLVETGRIRTDGKGRGARYFPVGVSVNSVSGGCHDTAQIGVKSPPL